MKKLIVSFIMIFTSFVYAEFGKVPYISQVNKYNIDGTTKNVGNIPKYTKIIIEINAVNQNSKSWDNLNGKPDIKVISDIKSFKKVYDNQYRIVKKVSLIDTDEIYFEIYDEDIFYDELIGKGYCNIKKICTLGLAKIKFIKY